MRNIFTHLRASLFPLLWVFIFSSVVESALNISGSYDMGRAIFDQKCAPCHTIGGCKKIGPDLRGVTERRKRDWLIRWLDNHGGEGHLDGWTRSKDNPVIFHGKYGKRFVAACANCHGIDLNGGIGPHRHDGVSAPLLEPFSI